MMLNDVLPSFYKQDDIHIYKIRGAYITKKETGL